MLKSIGLTDAHLYGELKEVPLKLLCGRTPRHAMQTLGTEWGRECLDENIWTNLWWEVAGPYIRLGKSVVVDDVRLLNEEAMVKLHGGQVWRVFRDKISDDLHSSEASIDRIPQTWSIFNTSTLPDLKDEVDRILSHS